MLRYSALCSKIQYGVGVVNGGNQQTFSIPGVLGYTTLNRVCVQTMLRCFEL